MTVTWFGQSTCLVQMDGYNILTDPIFSTRTIGSWFGPKRLRPPPCKLSELPRVDIVLVSHDHYDHLDRAVVKELGNSVTWYVPLGLRGWFNGHGVTNVIELDWWQEHTHTSVSPTQPTLLIASTPTQHWSGRHFFDVNRSLWSSFIVKGPRESLFHCGDTGYCGVFKEIGRKYGEVGLALLPIGAYEPRHVLHHQHISPSEALQIHTEINATHTVGVHWGTFMMSDEHYLDPPKVLEEGRRERGLRVGSVGVVGLGRTVRVGGGMFCADVPAEQSIPS
ncbi:beta-lactamase superfamily domain-containing protein [Fimicolochytrium jonesii]|uniref:beta-lactamase superfamily domain-containing protein n=1 Tax=Fimicolochytrium jonesii TaxID=1396493 RepID=UPI0022FE558C|nr:beta-lactamase superfamily domain-containing protein [Fimicolochytrium jonesii]KAI8818930.1 beta-lactamase superfamily domain-containing protein [Fimicolochytrium jonesii]